VTIIAGFKGYDGVVICADTQETVSGYKRKVPKLRVEPSDQKSSLAVAFCGAGHGPFIDKVVSLAWNDAQNATTLEGACTTIEGSIKASHDEFGKIYQPGYLPEIELIYGVKMDSGSRLFHAYGPTINEKEYYAAGAGSYMADFLASRMYRTHLDVRQLIILAAYVLFQAKEHVDGCGGDSHIAALNEDGLSGIVDFTHTEKLTELITTADHVLSEQLLSHANLKTRKKELKSNLKLALNLIETYRERTSKELKQREEESRWFFGPSPVNDMGINKPYKKHFGDD
jgi:20S proteasome alpha/beta subunit